MYESREAHVAHYIRLSRDTKRTDPSANELKVKLMTLFGVIVSIFNKGKH